MAIIHYSFGARRNNERDTQPPVPDEAVNSLNKTIYSAARQQDR
jgi:hypothetical protein